MKKIYVLSVALVLLICVQTFAQRRKQSASSASTSSVINDKTFADVKFRSIGPAFMGGRIADIAIHPDDESVWYVAVGSGGVWKTTNNGVTFKPIFDSQSVYSIGCITIDPSNPHTVWVGTGENVGGRHVGFGDGIYRSDDDGKTWKNMGLKASEHISEIIVNPNNSNKISVAVQGPLWSKGGERGFYMSEDGGKTWTNTLSINEWTGVTDIAMDPRNPDRMYAATWQRHRNVAAYMGGGPGTGLHKSEDGGKTWEKINSGLPKSNMGKIGLAISPQKPDILYAAIELDNRKGAVYKTENRGASWNKMSDAVSGATGPHYYQELYASPHQFDKIYLVDVRVQVSEDGGKTFKRMNESNKHSDNHSISWKMSDPDYLLVGTDGGIYETYDGEQNWRFLNSIAITQYYKVAVDDAAPFYNIYGGTQDTNTHGGPSRTDNEHGIRNSDWFITLFGDGHQPATEPGNPNIVYSQWQQGNLVRTDRSTGEIVYIKPQPEAGEVYERNNWDSPILVSPHDPKRLYFASQRVWRSDNRGDSWTSISGDLTKNQERFSLPIMGNVQSADNAWDVYAMSNYNTITSLAESPLQEGLIYAGTDDGLIQITENGGDSWRKLNVSALPGVPATAFVNDIKADLYDANTVYIALDNHKYGDFKPYIFKSTNKGASWTAMKSGLPDKTLVWRIVQDHVNKDLMFLATEFGIYFTLNGGGNWVKFTGGLPTISFRDLVIQKRENDLVGASFGRSFYVLDDYSFLREVSEQNLGQEGALFATRDAHWYIQRTIVGYGQKGNQGADYYTAKNPDFGATFTYYLKDDLKTDREARKESEKERLKNKQAVGFQGWDRLGEEERQQKPIVWLTVSDGNGNVIKRLKGSTKKGLHRLAWDLTRPADGAIRLNNLKEDPNNSPTGVMVGPGTYQVTLSKEVNGVSSILDGPRDFNVVPMQKGTLPGASPEAVAAFWNDISNFNKQLSAASLEINNAIKRAKAMRFALGRITTAPGDLDKKIHDLTIDLLKLEEVLNGDKMKRNMGEKTNPTLGDRVFAASIGTMRSTYGPTATHKRSLEIAKDKFKEIASKMTDIMQNKIPALERELSAAGAPWIEGQSLPIGSDY